MKTTLLLSRSPFINSNILVLLFCNIFIEKIDGAWILFMTAIVQYCKKFGPGHNLFPLNGLVLHLNKIINKSVSSKYIT